MSFDVELETDGVDRGVSSHLLLLTIPALFDMQAHPVLHPLDRYSRPLSRSLESDPARRSGRQRAGRLPCSTSTLLTFDALAHVLDGQA